MTLKIINDNIVEIKTDAIVNAANSSLLGGLGVDGAIHRAAGPELLEYCRGLGGCRTGQAKISPGFKLPSKYIIHTVGPIYDKNIKKQDRELRACYINSLKIAEKYGLKSVTFPLISAGAYGYPKEEAVKIAISTIKAFLDYKEMDVRLTLFDPECYRIGKSFEQDINDEKKALRDLMKGVRNDIPKEEHMAMSKSICKRIQDLEIYKEAKTIFAFMPFNGEPDLVDFFKVCDRDGKVLAFPVTYKDGKMAPFVPSNRKNMKKDTYGIASPDPNTDKSLKLGDIDLVLLPLLAVDDRGNRLGYGGGYYDRFLASLGNMETFNEKGSPVKTLGLAFDVQRIIRVPTDIYDRRISMLVTESDFIKF